jgi:hypothetical protein
MWIAIGIIIGVYIILSAVDHARKTLWNFTLVSPAKIHREQAKEIESLRSEKEVSTASATSLEEKLLTTQQELAKISEEYQKLKTDNIAAKVELGKLKEPPASFSIATPMWGKPFRAFIDRGEQTSAGVRPTLILATVKKHSVPIMEITAILLQSPHGSADPERTFPCLYTVGQELAEVDITIDVLKTLCNSSNVHLDSLRHLSTTIRISIECLSGNSKWVIGPQSYTISTKYKPEILSIIVNRIQSP